MFYGIRNIFNEATGIDLNEWTLVTKIKARKIKSTNTSLPLPITEMSLWTYPFITENKTAICGELGRIARRLLANDDINCKIHRELENYISINVSWELEEELICILYEFVKKG